jgi:hypothetical protein
MKVCSMDVHQNWGFWLQIGIHCAGLQGSSEVEGLAEVVRGGGARAAPPRVDEEGHRGGEV